MNRSFYWDLCEERLSFLCTRIELRGKLNILNFHLHAEDFYVNFLNVLFGYKLKNMNAVAQKASVKAQELREKQGVNRPVRATYIPKPRTDRKFKCVDGEMFRLNESTGKY